MRRPSGDHAGPKSGGRSSVMFRSPSPSGCMLRMSHRSSRNPANAMRPARAGSSPADAAAGASRNTANEHPTRTRDSVRGITRESGRSPIVWPATPGLLEAELVALRIAHDDPELASLLHVANNRGAEVGHPLHLPIDGCLPLVQRSSEGPADVEVEMDAVLRHLRLRNALEVE